MKFVMYDTPIEDVVAGLAAHGLALVGLSMRGKTFLVTLGRPGASLDGTKFRGEGATVADAANAAFRAFSEAQFALNFFWFNARAAALPSTSPNPIERVLAERALALDVLERVLHYAEDSLSDEQVRVVRETLKTLR